MATIQQKTVRTHERSAEAAAQALVDQLAGTQPKLAVLFASWRYDQQALHAALRARLPKQTQLIGASSSGEIDAEGMHQESAVLTALWGDIEVGVGVGKELAADALKAGATAMQAACAKLGVAPAAIDRRKYIGIVFDDGLQYKKDELLLGARSTAPTVTLVGGGATDHPMSTSPRAWLHGNGEALSNAVLIALIRTEAPWAVMQSHSYEPTGQFLRITRVDTTRTRALEIDGQPAARRYAELLGVSVDELEFGKPHGFATRPLAQKLGREYFLNAPWKPLPDGSVLFGGMIDVNSEFELMRLTDMVASTRQFLVEEIPKRVPNPQVAFLFHCSGRMWFAHQSGQTEALSRAFQGVPYVAGLNVQFEIFRSLHVNTTLTSLVLG